MMHKVRGILVNLIEGSFLEAAARRAYTLVNWNKKSHKYDRQTKKVLGKALKQGSNCIDVGAYRGQVLQYMQKAAPNGQLFAFEPAPKNYRYLKKKFGKARVYNYALSDKKGQAKFYYVKGRPARSGLKKQPYPNPNEKVKEIKVKVKRLNDVVPKDINIDLIKVDVEGAELKVFKGARRVLQESKPIILFEHYKEHAETFGTAPKDVYSFLTELGYKISTMERWLNNQSACAKEEFAKVVNTDKEFQFIAY